MGYTDSDREQAVALYLEHGLAEAHRLTRTDERPKGIPKQTLQTWAKNAGHDLDEIAGRTNRQTRNATIARRATWEARKADVILDLADLVQTSIAAAQRYIDTGQPEKARSCVAPFGVGIEKLQLLTGEATSRPAIPWDPKKVTEEAEVRARGLRSVPTGAAVTP